MIHLETVSKNILMQGLNRFQGANLSSGEDEDTYMFGLHERFVIYPCIS